MVKKKEKEITKLELLESINRSFNKLEAKMATKGDVEGIIKRLDSVENKIDGIDNRIDDFVATRVKYEDHNKLKARVGFIEEKLEIK